MSKKTTLAKKLASYSLFTSVVLAPKEDEAQIVYHDVNPDFSVQQFDAGIFNLDLNADGINDFNLLVFHVGETSIVGFYSGESSGSLSPSAISNVALSLGQDINSSSNWSNSFRMAFYYTCNTDGGIWYNKADHYLGVRFPLDGDYYYGWVRLDVYVNGKSLVVKDYAYETQPNTPIVAGDIGCNSVPLTPTITQLADESLLSSVEGIQWYLNGDSINLAINDTLVTYQSGFYSTRLTDSAGCVTASAPFNFIRCDSVGTYAVMIADTAGNSICSGSLVSFQFIDNINPNFQFQWYKNGSPVPGATSAYYNPGPINSSASFFAVIQNPAINCIDSTDIFSLNVLQTPSPPVITQQGDESLVSSVANGNQWYLDGSALPGANNDTLIAFESGLYSDKVTDSSGCTSSSSAAFNFIKCDSLDAHATMTADTIGNYICYGLTAKFHLTNTIATNFQFQWYKNGAAIPGAISYYYTTPPITEPVTYFGILQNTITDCSDTTEIFYLDTLPSPSAPLITQTFDTLITQTGYVTYQWKKSYNPVVITGATNNFYKIPSDNYYCVEVSNSSGCTAISNKIYYKRCGYFQPTVTAGGSTVLCNGDSVSLSVNNFPDCTYKWYRANVNLNDFDTITFANQEATYKCTIQDILHNCTWNPTINISVSIPSPPQIYIVGDSLIATPSYFYQWYLNGDTIPGATDQSYHPAATGYYSVSITNIYGCSEISQQLFYEVIATSAESLNELVDEKWIGGSVKIFNELGQLLFTEVISDPDKINLDQFRPGMYYVVLHKDKLLSVFKLFKTE